MTTHSNIAVRISPIHGKGVFAEKNIQKGDIIHQMNGKEVGILKCFLLILTKKVQIDMPLQISNSSYYILDEFSESFNHSCEPLCAITNKNEVIAIRDIEAGEELTYDYSMTVLPTFYTKSWKMPCSCNKKTCRKYISTVNSISDTQLIDYIKENKMQDFMRNYFFKHHPDLFES